MGSLHAATPDHRDQLIQFISAGHVLGFKPDGYYVANGGYMLHVGFVGTDGVEPKVIHAAQENSKTQHLNRITYTDMWPGVTLHFEAVGGGIAMSTWEIAANTDVNQIRLIYHSPVEILADGSLNIRFESGWMRESAPIAWQEVDGERKPVEIAFHILEASGNESMIGFKTGRYDSAHTLLIDPTLTWNTFMGSYHDHGKAIALDVWGNVYVTGRSQVSWGKPVNPHAGNSENDAFVAKLDVSGKLLWNTFMGSTDEDSGDAIAVDIWGNVYVAGKSRATWGMPVSGYTAGIDAFAAKLDTKGARLWHTFMGSSSYDLGKAIAVDFWGNRVYVVGTSGGAWGSPVRPYAGGGSDAFAAGLIGSSGVLAGHTFLGSPSNDSGNGMALDGAFNVYVVGTSDQSWGNPVKPYSGEVFVAKVNGGGVLQWNTFIGGSTSRDFGNAVALDSSGNIYVAGDSSATWGTPVNAHAGGDPDAFAAMLDVNGNLQWNTFMGAENYFDDGNAIKVDVSGNVYVAGDSYNTWGKPVNAYKGSIDAFVAKLEPGGKRLLHTFLGSTSEDHGNAIAVDSLKNVHVVGASRNNWGTPINDHTDIGYNAFAAKLDDRLKLNNDGCNYFILPLKDGTVFPVCL
jgi:hypothetical protein